MLIHPLPPHKSAMPSRKAVRETTVRSPPLSLESLSEDVIRHFTGHIDLNSMLSMSNDLRQDYREQARSNDTCMLPSFNHTLPTGQETGTYLALDLGGSTFRIALVEMRGRRQGKEALRILRQTTSKINERIRRLNGVDFFDWMAARIAEMLTQGNEGLGYGPQSLPVGLSWSFPIEQTSARGGRVQNMGKGFQSHRGTIGQDLSELIVDACRARNLNLKLDAIINDSSATLLARAYLEGSTSMSLIVGTGTNAAAFLPATAIGKRKFGDRHPAWHKKANKVIVNTELSMFGKEILPKTRWDEVINRLSPLPDFQPLEYMTTGRYLGELLRLVIIEAVDTAGLFYGHLPKGLEEPYTLDTSIMAMIEQDTSVQLIATRDHIMAEWAITRPPSYADMLFLRGVTEGISHRAAVYLAVAIHALWALEKETEYEFNPTSPGTVFKTTISCDGSVICKYPGFRERCQGYIASMIRSDFSAPQSSRMEKVILEPAVDAAILGAAVAVAIAEND